MTSEEAESKQFFWRNQLHAHYWKAEGL